VGRGGRESSWEQHRAGV